MLGKKDLQEKLIQRESTLAQREAEIAILTKKIEELTAYESNMHTELENYRSRKEAIVSVLTEAQETGTRIKEEADAYKSQVMGSVYSERDAAKQESETIMRMARQQATQLLTEANEQAAEIKAKADEYVSSTGQQAEVIKERLREMAEETQRQSEAFASILLDISNTQTNTAKVLSVNLPDEYSSPANLMQNIYAIQGRDIPIDDYIEGIRLGTMDIATDDEVNAILAEVISAIDSGKEVESDEEQVFSVEDVLAAGPIAMDVEDEPAQAPRDLDSIIDDILKGI